MHWKELLANAELITLPWLGTRAVHSLDRGYRVVGALPDEIGWHRFEIGGSRRATWRGVGEADFDFAEGRPTLSGYLVEDRLIPDDEVVNLDVRRVFRAARPIELIEPGLARFARGLVARQRDGSLIYVRQEMPLGPEPDVLEAYQERSSLDGVRGVTPALHLAFLWYSLRREQVERRRAELERQAREAAEQEARRAMYGAARRDANARRQLAATDFEAAARAALELGGAQLLDVRPGYQEYERVVQMRFKKRRLECTVHRDTLRVIDAGICLIDHATDERGDQRFTLESLVAVIDEAMRTGRLVVFRHA